MNIGDEAGAGNRAADTSRLTILISDETYRDHQ
jgi:hypothetical protein